MDGEARQLGRLWACSASMRALFDRIEEAARADAPIVIQGETGTGKELVAEAMHELSPRADGPYVVVDCAAVPGELIESELFGHMKGAFTGALVERRGAFEAADGGTIFIDEIGELPLELQAKLLRVLETQQVKRLGQEATRKVNCRVVSATNRDLLREVEEERFRRDLYYRLNVVLLQVPPLRERPEDIRLLVRRFLEPYAALLGELELPDDVERTLVDYPWPGNVRELKNVVDQGATMSDRWFRLPDDFGLSLELDGAGGLAPGSGVGLVEDGFAPEAADRAPPEEGAITRPLWEGKAYRDAKDAVMADFERGYVRALLDAHEGNVSAAARAAGIHRNILHRMMARYDIER